jgi:RNA polymerase sigma-70 factor (ECF subfamily)
MPIISQLFPLSTCINDGNMTDDHVLASKAVRGDHDAFSELVIHHQAGVYNTAYRMTGNRQDAEDVAQETFLRAFRAIGTLDPSRPPGPWFRKIAVNISLNRLEKHPALPFEDEYLVTGSWPASSKAPQPELQTIEQERNRAILGALLALSPRFRAVIELRHYQELSYTEIAESLDRPESDVKSDLFRARRLLAERLKDLL